jgi:hypothetical protein
LNVERSIAIAPESTYLVNRRSRCADRAWQKLRNGNGSELRPASHAPCPTRNGACVVTQASGALLGATSESGKTVTRVLSSLKRWRPTLVQRPEAYRRLKSSAQTRR